MKTTAVPKSTPPVTRTTRNQVAPDTNALSLIGLGLQMTLVVLVPVLIGRWLDGQHGGTGSTWTLVGFAISMIGLAGLIFRTVQQLNQDIASQDGAPKDDTHV